MKWRKRSYGGFAVTALGFFPLVMQAQEASGVVGDSWGAFVQSFLIILREGFEAILIVGAIAALLVRTGHRSHLRAIWIGVIVALVASVITAILLETALSAVPASAEIVEGITMLVAVAVLFSVSYWLISRAEAAKWQQFISEQVNRALQSGGGTALGLASFLAVYREGAETALFYQALFADASTVAGPLILGGLVGAVALVVVFTLFYRFGIRIPLRAFFMVTSVLLYLLAFIFAGKGVHELQEGGAISETHVAGPRIADLGIYPTVETLALQSVLLVLFIYAVVKTFGPGAQTKRA
jgi:high-affinity iron transporter